MATLVWLVVGADTGEVEDTAEEAGVEDTTAEEEEAEALEHSVATSPPSSSRLRRLFGDTNDCLHARITTCWCAVSAVAHSALHDTLGWKSVESGQLSMGRL